MTQEEEERLSKVVQKAVDSALGEFSIDKEMHYNHHQTWEGLVQLFDGIKEKALTALVVGFILGLFSLVGVGIVAVLFLKGEIFKGAIGG